MIDDMAVYIANLGKYNEGYLVGAWFTFPTLAVQRYRVPLLKISRVPASEKRRLQNQNSILDSPRINA